MDLFHHIVNSSTNLIFFSLDMDYRYLLFNNTHAAVMKSIWGIEIKEGVSMLEYITLDQDREKAKVNFDRAIGGEEFTLLEEYGEESLQRSYYEDYYAPLKNEKEEIIGLTVFVTDISQRMRENKIAEQNAELLGSINTNVQEGIFRSTPEKFLYANSAMVKMFGYDREEELSKIPITALFSRPEDKETCFQILETDGSMKNHEILFKRKDGSEFWGSSSAVLQFTADGFPVVDGAVRNIEEEKKNDADLEMMVRSTSTIMGIAHKYLNIGLDRVELEITKSLEVIGKFCKADRAYVFDINQEKNTCSNTFEWCREGVSSEIENCQDLPLELFQESLPRCYQGLPVEIPDVEKVASDDYRRYLKEQKIKSLLVVPTMDNGEFVGLIGLDYVFDSHEITEIETQILELFAEILTLLRNRLASQEEKQILLETTTQQNNRLKNFSYITSHNIRSSVTNLSSLIEIQKQDPTNTEVHQMLRATTEKLDDTISNINELLNFEHEIEGGLTRFPCRLAEAVNHSLNDMKSLIVKKGAIIHNSIQSDLEVLAFPAYLDSIVYNLISNALKYGVSDDSKEIWLQTEIDDKAVKLSVIDKGFGIDLNKFGDRIFNLGARFHKKTDTGQGLGLFMTKRQIEAMGGTIAVKSTPEKGSCFEVFLEKS